MASSTFTMPVHATVWEDARDFGAGWGSWKIPLGGWQFSFGDVGWTNGFAWVEGYFRSRFNSRANEIRLLSDRLALCPAANWSRYNLAASRAWCVTNDVDGLIVAFENAAIGDDQANAILKVDVRTGYGTGAGFGPGEVKWKWISGPCTIQSNGWYAVVTPTAANGEVEIEARFNEDEIQPRFVLPIVMPKTVNIRAYLVDPPEGRDDLGWDAEDVTNRVSVANEIFAQAGIKFNLLSVGQAVAMTTDWVVRDREIEVDGNGRTNKVVSAQTHRLFSANHSDDAVDVIFTGAIEGSDVVGFKCDFGVVLGKRAKGRALAHELGHILTLKDCFDRIGEGESSKEIFGGENSLIPQFFDGGGQDWGRESQRGFYGLENDLPNVLRTLLMHGKDEDGRVDIPMFRITGLPEEAGSEWLTDKIKVGAHYIDFRATKGERSREE